MFNNVTIYKPNPNGTISTWRIVAEPTVEGFAQYTAFSAKIIGGKEKETLTEIKEGKQDRNVLGQALAEAHSKFKTKLRKGYSEIRPEEGARAKNTLGFNIAVKAQKWAEVDHKPPYTISPKLDGHHMSAAVSNGQVVLYSMNSKVLDIEHIRQELQSAYDMGKWGGSELDGELYRHGLELDEIKSRIKRTDPEHHHLQFHLYDCMWFESGYAKRKVFIDQILDFCDETIICPVETLQVFDVEAVRKQREIWIANGYEGLMARWGDMGYADTARSKYVLKDKVYQDAEFKLLGIQFGKPKHKEGKQYDRPVLVLQASNGEKFKCGLHGTMQETHEHAHTTLFDKVGQMYTVKFFKLTARGVPSQPVGIRFRNDV